MDRLFRFKDLKPYYPFCRSKMYMDIENGTFPKPVKLGRSIVWKESDIKEWLTKQTPLPAPKTPIAPPPERPKKKAEPAPRKAPAVPPAPPKFRTLERRA